MKREKGIAAKVNLSLGESAIVLIIGLLPIFLVVCSAIGAFILERL